MKYEWRKQEKQLYFPKKIEQIEIPKMHFVTLAGAGNPNSPIFGEQIAALYGMAYQIRMGLKKGLIGEASEYTVYPLEGVWTSKEKPDGPVNKDDLIYKIMIRQPESINKEIFEEQLTALKQKKENRFFDQLQFDVYEEGASVQTIHLGSFDTECETFEKMHQFMAEHNLINRLTMGDFQHREIYLTDPRKSAPEKAKTVLRYRVQANQ